MQVIYQGTPITIDPKKSIGSGGEANIVVHGNVAFKIYHQPTAERAKKLQDFLSHRFAFPVNVMAPIDNLYDNRNKVIGFAMGIADNCKDIRNLSVTKFRSVQQITTNHVVDCFTQTKTTLDSIHDLGIIVGDFNDLNILFDITTYVPIYIDVDSFQFDSYPCIVGTEDFIDPSLYGVDLTKKPMFTQQTDWYSFAVILFKSLFFVHPYGGIQQQHKTLFTRAQNNVWVFDKSVTYPVMGKKPETISDELLTYFSEIFCHGQRPNLPITLLQSLQNSFIECSACKTFYHNSRGTCPQCMQVTPQITANLSKVKMTKQVGKEQCVASTLFQIEGTILFTKVINDTIVVISYDGKNTNLSLVTKNSENTITLWQGFQKDFRYEYFLPHYLVVAQNTKVLIFDVSNKSIKHVGSTSTMLYRNEPVITCDNDGFYRLTNNTIMRGSIVGGNNFIETDIMSSIENQTWIQAGKYLNFGFYRIFEKYQFFIFTPTVRYEIKLPDLPGQVIDMDVITSVNSVLLLRKNIHNGRTYSHWHIIDDKGKILETKSEESISSELLSNIYGKTFAGSNLIHPTDSGIAIEKHGNVSVKASTASYVNDSSQLMLYTQGILSILTNKIIYLELS